MPLGTKPNDTEIDKWMFCFPRTKYDLFQVPDTISYSNKCNAELFEICNTTKLVTYLHGFIQELGQVPKRCPTILTDSESSVNTLHKPVSEQYKYIAVPIHFVKEKIEHKQVKVVYIKRNQNSADLLTKQADLKTFQQLWTAVSTPFQWIHKRVRYTQ